MITGVGGKNQTKLIAILLSSSFQQTSLTGGQVRKQSLAEGVHLKSLIIQILNNKEELKATQEITLLTNRKIATVYHI